MNSHLTDEQLTELILGESSPETEPHLLACTQCQSELTSLRAALNDFAVLGLAWADKKASVTITTPSALVRNWSSMSTGAAAAVVLAAAVLLGVHQESGVAAEGTPAVSQTSDFASEVAADDRLMTAIDHEIQWQTESAVSNVDFAAAVKANPARSVHRLTN